MIEQWKSNLIVGTFVVTVLTIFLYFIMNYTNELGMFEPTVYIHTTFKQPVGLFDGAAVQLNNVKIGRITGIRFSEKITDNTVYITMIVNRSDLPRIGKDAIATISTVGLLGDNIINIEAGHPTVEGHIEAEDYIKSKEFGGLLSGVENILKKIDEEGIESISSTIRNASEITEQIKRGEGSLGKLITEETLFNEIELAISQINRIIRRINQGPGSVHSLIYRDDVGRVLADLKQISKNLEQVSLQIKDVLGDIQDQEVAKKVGKMADNLATASESLARVAKSIEEGEGTVGALIKDPTLYEDLKVILQGAKRSKALRYAIQHTIRRKQKAAERKKRRNDSEEPSAAPPTPPPSQ